jgi:imidazolonepropionase-like amidohydrolase
VVTTIDIGDSEKDPERRKRVRATQAENLRKLKTAGVVLVLGTDGLPGGTVTEIADLKATGVFSNRELLNMASEVTPTAIFPGRKVGRLRDGYEASFLVLAKNPVEDIAATKEIVMTVKNGRVTRQPAPSQPKGVN